MVLIAVPADWILMLFDAVDCKNWMLMNRFADAEVEVVRTLFPIPTSSEELVEMFVSTFILVLKETYPFVFAVIWFVGEKANITCDPVDTLVVFLYLAILLPLSFVIVV